MQALGSYEGGHMLFLVSAPASASAMIRRRFSSTHWKLRPSSLQKGKTYEDYLGLRGSNVWARKKWRRPRRQSRGTSQEALAADYVVLGGGNSKKLDTLPDGAPPRQK